MATQTATAMAEVMKERSSIKKFDAAKEIPEETLTEILELANTAPSSWNLQHWKFLVIQKSENKQRLHPIAFNQPQIVDSSAVVVVLGDIEANKNAEPVYSEAVELGYMTKEAKETLIGQINGAYESSESVGIYQALSNTSLAAMQLMLAAKANGVDSCPMGGFDGEALRKEWDIPDRYTPVMLIALGYQAAPAHKTTRFPLEQVVFKESL